MSDDVREMDDEAKNNIIEPGQKRFALENERSDLSRMLQQRRDAKKLAAKDRS